ncbi:MAG: hypothetical protein ACE5I2_14605 [Anaerolineae bacterium]
MIDYLRRVNSWAAIAILALIGWLIDSLLWFLETHSLTVVGFVTYLSHSWYALPLLAGIFVILRLRSPSELLSLTIYDARGVPIHRQGDFRLEESVLGPILSSFQGTGRGAGLHRIDLPSGPVVYFLRQGALTLVACFSGLPRPAQLEAGLRLLRQEAPPTEDLLRDLPPDVAALTANLFNAPVERDLLTYLWNRRQVAMTAADLAGHVGHDEGEVTPALENLERLTLVHRQYVCDMTFYRLTGDETWLARLDQFIAWRVDWLARVRRVEQLVGPTSLAIQAVGRSRANARLN